MKKTVIFILAAALIACPLAASAAEVNESSPEKTVTATIQTDILPTYIISIPTGADIAFNAESTELGEIKAVHMQIEPDKEISVSAEKGEFTNQTDTAKALPYKLMSGENEWTKSVFSAENQAATLSVAIAAADWDTAPAGSYKGSIVFTVSYDDKSAD